MKKNIFVTALALSIITPVVSFAALEGIASLIKTAGGLLNQIIPIVFGLALVFFFWGMAQFILHAGEEEAREQGKQRMLWGIVALFVIVSIYGILGFIGNSLNINQGGSSGIPTCPNGVSPDTGACN